MPKHSSHFIWITFSLSKLHRCISMELLLMDFVIAICKLFNFYFVCFSSIPFLFLFLSCCPPLYVTSLNSDSIQSEQTRSSSENLPFSISRLLSKPYENNNKSPASDRDTNSILLDSEHAKLATHLANVGIPYSTASALYSSYSPFYNPGQVLRVPPQRTPLTWQLPPLHPAALAHQAVKDRLAGECHELFL